MILDDNMLGYAAQWGYKRFSINPPKLASKMIQEVRYVRYHCNRRKAV